MKKLTAIILGMAVVLAGKAQQRPHYTQYVLNQYVINPALSGIENYVDLRLSHRHQWTGIQDAPITTYLTIQGPIGKQDSRTSVTGFAPEGNNPRGKDYWSEYSAAAPHHGWGAQLLQDVTGPLTRTAVYGTYAYHLGLTARTSIAAGFGLGMSSLRLDASKVHFDQVGDPSVLQTGIMDQWKPDLTAGLYLYSRDYFLGLSAQQIIPQKVEFRENQLRKEDGKLIPHLFATGGYRFLLGEDFNLLPSVMVKYTSPLPAQLEFNTKLQYRDRAWMGASFRVNDGFAAMAGLNVSGMFTLGYSYDYTTSGLNSFSRGTHELLLGFLFGNSYGDTCPRNLW